MQGMDGNHRCVLRQAKPGADNLKQLVNTLIAIDQNEIDPIAVFLFYFLEGWSCHFAVVAPVKDLVRKQCHIKYYSK